MATTTKKDLIERVSQETGVSRADSRKVVQSFLEAVIGELAKGNRLEFRDFGVFEIRERAGRVAQNPKTLERVAVPPRRSVRFKVGRLMQQSLETGVDGLVAVDGGVLGVRHSHGLSLLCRRHLSTLSCSRKHARHGPRNVDRYKGV